MGNIGCFLLGLFLGAFVAIVILGLVSAASIDDRVREALQEVQQNETEAMSQ